MADPDEGGTRPAAAAGSSAGGGSLFSRKLFGIPVWLLMLAGLGLALAYVAIRKNKSAAQSSTANTAAAAAAGASQTPPFIIQNFPPNGGTAPTGHPATPTGTAPPPAPLPTYTVTGHGDQNVDGLIATLYKTPASDTTEYAVIANAILAVNPNRQGWGAKIPVGTVINLPPNYVAGKQVL
jgi:hypothetical protein